MHLSIDNLKKAPSKSNSKSEPRHGRVKKPIFFAESKQLDHCSDRDKGIKGSRFLSAGCPQRAHKRHSLALQDEADIRGQAVRKIHPRGHSNGALGHLAGSKKPVDGGWRVLKLDLFNRAQSGPFTNFIPESIYHSTVRNDR